MNASSETLGFDIVARIAERAPELRSAERKVAALILDDLTGASRASIGAATTCAS
jgi:DNA-binding MurR/RpiR family transcriptional regulator